MARSDSPQAVAPMSTTAWLLLMLLVAFVAGMAIAWAIDE